VDFQWLPVWTHGSTLSDVATETGMGVRESRRKSASKVYFRPPTWYVYVFFKANLTLGEIEWLSSVLCRLSNRMPWRRM
jgi:hypothetical protein